MPTSTESSLQMKERYDKSHPSFGMIGFSRITGGRRQLFASALKDHGTTIRLQITQARMGNDLGRDWIRGDIMPIIEVEMSPAQWAEFITSPNIGSGVPCTIRTLDKKSVEEPPLGFGEEHERVKDDVKNHVKDLTKAVIGVAKRTTAIFDSPGKVTKAERTEILGMLGKLESLIGADVPFLLDQLDEAAGKIVTNKVAEADAFITHALQMLGLRGLKEAAQKMLGEGEKPSDPTIIDETD